MKVEYINPFVTSTQLVFSTLLDCQVKRGQPVVKEGCEPSFEVSGLIDLVGKAHGTVVLSLAPEVAMAVTEKMLESPVDEINAKVADAVGELTNVIAGRAKADLERFSLSVSLPRVVMGKSEPIDFPAGSTPITIPFDSPWGPLAVEVGLVEEPVECSLAT